MHLSAQTATPAVWTYGPTVCALLLVALTVSSCDAIGDVIGGNDLPDTLVPLESGNRWQAVAREDTTLESASFRILEGDAELRLVRPDDAVPYNMPLKEASSGSLLVKWARTRGDIDGSMRFNYPVSDGETYTYTDSHGEKQSFNISVSRDSVTVPVGTFDCFIYTVRQSKKKVAEAAIKPGFGPVRVSLNYENSVLELIDTNVQF